MATEASFQPKHRSALPGAAAYALRDGRFAVVVEPPLGRLSARQRHGLQDIARRYAFGGMVEPNPNRVEIRGVDPELVPLVIDEVHSAGLPVAGDRR